MYSTLNSHTWCLKEKEEHFVIGLMYDTSQTYQWLIKTLSHTLCAMCPTLHQDNGPLYLQKGKDIP